MVHDHCDSCGQLIIRDVLRQLTSGDSIFPKRHSLQANLDDTMEKGKKKPKGGIS
jgi:hypothetical protein